MYHPTEQDVMFAVLFFLSVAVDRNYRATKEVQAVLEELPCLQNARDNEYLKHGITPPRWQREDDRSSSKPSQ